MPKKARVTLWSVFKFWFPLSLNWQMMAIEAPFTTGIISRLPNPKLNLAAFGVAFAWGMIIESPVIPLLSASAALSKNNRSYFLLRRFMWHMNLLSTALQILFICPPVFNFIAHTALNLPDDVARLAYRGSLILIPWSAAIGYRRFYQGIMIRGGMPHKVAIGTVMRMAAMAITAGFLYSIGTVDGASVGSMALVAAVIAEAFASRVMARSALAKLLSENSVDEKADEKALTYSTLVKFYVPLAMTTLIGLGIQPLTTLALGHSILPLDSLAVLPVVNALNIFLMCSVFSVQEITIVLVGDSFEYRKVLRNFAWLLGGVLSLILAAVAFSRVGLFWFTNIAGLPVTLIPLAFAAAQCGVVLPIIRSWESYQRALMVKAHATAIVTGVAIFELVIVAAALYALTQPIHMIGVVAAILSVTIGAACAELLYIRETGRAIKRRHPKGLVLAEEFPEELQL